MKSDFKAVKAVQIIFGAIILSCCIFGGIYGIGVNGLTIFFNNSRYIYDHESPYVQEFQQYVSQNNIATSDISECDEWMDYHCVLFCIIEKDGEAVYSKLNVDKFIVSAKNMYDSRKIAKYQLPVNFADGEANVYIYAGYTEKHYLGVIILGIVISILSGAYVIYRCVNNIIKDYKVNIGKAHEQERKARDEKDQLMRNMAHDLRTPLTGLMTYIDILKLQNKSNESINKNLDILTSKVNELRDLSNLLLDFSIASSDENIHLDEPSFVEYAIGDYLSEMHTIISQNGFCVNIDGIYWEKVKVAVNGSLLSRIFSNLTNNICKYADIDEQVVMETVYSKNIFEICISNTVCKEKSLLESTGLGLKNVELLMRRMHGRAIYETKEYCYYVKLRFPITN